MNTRKDLLRYICRWILSALLGVLSVADKHQSLFYLSAPTLSAAASRIYLSPTGVMAGQMTVLFFPSARPILPVLILLWLFPLAFPARVRARRQISPGMLFGILLIWQAGSFLFAKDSAALITGLCGGILASCALYFVTYIKNEVPHNKALDSKGYIACILMGIFFLMLCDSTSFEGLTTQIAALLLILIGGLMSLWQGILSGCLFALAGATAMGDPSILPMFLAAATAVVGMKKWGKRVYSSALILCSLLALLPSGIFLEHPLWLMSAPVSGVIFLLLPLHALPRQKAPQALSSQYEELVRRVDKLQKSARARISFYPEIAERAGELLRQAGAQNISVTCAKDLLGGFFLDVTFEGGRLTAAALLGLMERAAGFALTPRRCFIKEESTCACFVRRAPYTVQCAALCKTKEGETVCGDNALAFSADQAHYILLLSDGMGSGKDAFAQSCWTLTLLQKLLRAGLRAEGALGMVHSSLRLANEDIAFATADLCSIDLWTGQARFVKAGALSSFILRGEEIIEVSAVSMPLGAVESPDVAAVSHTLKEQDILLLISDGAYDQKDHLLFALQKHRSLPIDVLARRLMRAALPEGEEPNDDVTVLVARFCKNN